MSAAAKQRGSIEDLALPDLDLDDEEYTDDDHFASSAEPPVVAAAAATAAAVIKPSTSHGQQPSLTRQFTLSSSQQPPHPSISLHSLQANAPHRVDLDALGISSPDAYLLMFRTVLTLQRKCRSWRVRTKEKIRKRVEAEKKRQEDELQLKLEKKQRIRAEQQEARASISRERASLSGISSGTAPRASVFTVELPADDGEFLKFKLCMMKIQVRFRAKLAKARARLKEKLQKEREAQERDMAEKIAKRKAKRASLKDKVVLNNESKDFSLTSTSAASPASSAIVQTINLSSIVPEHEEVIEPVQGSLTSRLRQARKAKAEEADEKQQQLRTKAALVDQMIQCDEDELRINLLDPALLYVAPSSYVTKASSEESISRRGRERERQGKADADAASVSHAGNNKSRKERVPLTELLGQNLVDSLTNLANIDERNLREKHLLLMAMLATPSLTPSFKASSSSIASSASLTTSLLSLSPMMLAPSFLPQPLLHRVFPNADVDSKAVDLLSIEHLLHLPMVA